MNNEDDLFIRDLKNNKNEMALSQLKEVYYKLKEVYERIEAQCKKYKSYKEEINRLLYIL